MKHDAQCAIVEQVKLKNIELEDENKQLKNKSQELLEKCNVLESQKHTFTMQYNALLSQVQVTRQVHCELQENELEIETINKHLMTVNQRLEGTYTIFAI